MCVVAGVETQLFVFPAATLIANVCCLISFSIASLSDQNDFIACDESSPALDTVVVEDSRNANKEDDSAVVEDSTHLVEEVISTAVNDVSVVQEVIADSIVQEVPIVVTTAACVHATKEFIHGEFKRIAVRVCSFLLWTPLEPYYFLLQETGPGEQRTANFHINGKLVIYEPVPKSVGKR